MDNRLIGESSPQGGANPDPGTEGPDGFLDDQPQREDEYLSSLLRDFNPQRRESDGQAPKRSRG